MRCQWCEEIVENGIECPVLADLSGVNKCFGSNEEFAGVEYYAAAVAVKIGFEFPLELRNELSSEVQGKDYIANF